MFPQHLICSALATCLLLICPLAGAADPGDALLGKWHFPKKNGKMEITKSGNVYNGKVIEYEKPEQIDDKNPDPALKNRKFVGINMLADFTYDPGDKKWIDGTIYDAESGKTYSCSLWFEDDDKEKTKLNARGYIGISLFGRTEVFQRVTKADEEAEAKAKAEAEAQQAEEKQAEKKNDAAKP